LFYTALQEAYTFIKSDADMLTQVGAIAKNSLQGLAKLGQGKMRTDTFAEPVKKEVT
jgi:hypothetical protein